MKKCYILLLSCFAFGLQSVASEGQNQDGSAAQPKVPQPYVSYKEATDRDVTVDDLPKNVMSDEGTQNVVHIMRRCFENNNGFHHPCSLEIWQKIFGIAHKNGLMNSTLGRYQSDPRNQFILHRILNEPGLFWW